MPPYAVTGTEKVWNEKPVGPKTASSFVKKPSEGQRKSRKSVSFQDTVTYREITPLTEISEDEIRDVWYNDDEYLKIKKVITATVKKAESGGVVDEKKGISMRGIEGRTKFGARRRKNNKAAALDAVWTTQVALWKKKLDKPLAITAAYRPHATHAKYRALQAGHNDEMYVKDHVRL